MGTLCAPPYENLLMRYLKKKLYERVEKIFDQQYKEYKVWRNIKYKKWKHFLGCFIFYQYTEFINILNTLHLSVKFTTEFGCNELPYLDIHIKIQESTSRQTYFRKEKKNWQTPIFKFLLLLLIANQKKHPIQHSKTHLCYSDWAQITGNPTQRTRRLPHNAKIPLRIN